VAVLGVQRLMQEGGGPAAWALEVETHVSFPVAAPRPRGMRVIFLYCRSSVSPTLGLQLMPPHYLAELDPDSGRLERMVFVEPAEFGRQDPPEDYIGRYDMLPNGRTSDQYHALRAQLLAAYDKVLPAFLRGASSFGRELRQAAQDFLSLFPQVTEQPLLPYYREVGKDMFAWLERAAR